MKILFVNNDINRLGGIDKCFTDDVSLFRNSGYQVYTLVTNQKIRQKTPQDYFYKEPSFAPLRYLCAYFDIFFLIRVWFWISKVKPTIVHIHGYPLQIITLILILRLKKIPFIQTVHDASFTICPSGLLIRGINNPCAGCPNLFGIKCLNSFCRSITWVSGKKWLQWFLIYGLRERLRIKLMKKWVAISISPSKALADLMTSHNFNVRNIYNSIDITNDSNAQPEAHTQNILYIGRLHFTKGVNHLIIAMKKAVGQFPKAKLRIIGDGPEKNNLIQLTKSLSLSDNITFVGAVQSNKVKKYINSSLFSVIPSIWFENNPLSVIEVMSLGRPVIGSKMGGIPELVIHNKTGLLFEAANTDQLSDAIINLLSNSKLVEVLGDNARQAIIQRFSSQTRLQNLITLYQEFYEKAESKNTVHPS
ncbi:MAG TPA: glycosyltransferase family 4 protein [Candidatus Paceibacterota bacterium]